MDVFKRDHHRSLDTKNKLNKYKVSEKKCYTINLVSNIQNISTDEILIGPGVDHNIFYRQKQFKII